LTDIELSNACLLRGLPIATMLSQSLSTLRNEMIQSLTEHLNIHAALLQFIHESKWNPQSLTASNHNDHNVNQNPLPLAKAPVMTDQDMEQIGLFLLLLPMLRSIIVGKPVWSQR
jgi:hypothetical protein